MKFRKSCIFTAVVLAFGLAVGQLRAAPVTTQSITLAPGWNAIWLEVDPVNDSPASIFAGVNIDSVWGWSAPQTSTQYIDDPAEPKWNTDQMLVYMPATRPESFQNNLSALQAHRPYLVKLLGAVPITVTISGTPTLPTVKWKANAYNLRGYPVDPANKPSFLNFFKFSSAHYANNKLTAIYKLNGAGVWTAVAAGDLMEPGIAYWTYCNGASKYLAPLEADVPVIGSLDFDLDRTSATIALLNRRDKASSATIKGLNVNSSISQVTSSPTTGLQYTPITGDLAVSVGENAQIASVVLQLDRERLPADLLEQIATITDGQGVRFRIPLTAKRITAGTDSDPALVEAKLHAGLWVGQVTVTGVSESHSGTLTTIQVASASGAVHDEIIRTGVGTTATPVPQPFVLKMLLHVDNNGVTRLLKEVVQMFQEGTYTTAADGFSQLTGPGRYVLLTDDTLIPHYVGSTVVDGKPVGQRISTIDFDFPSTSPANYFQMTGLFAVNSSVTATLVMSPNLPTNPFRHKFHPDHDNLAADYQSVAPRAEVYEITRQIELKPTATDPSGKTPPKYGDSVIAGTYRETVSGLHKIGIIAEGTFSLTRISQNGVLNQ